MNKDKDRKRDKQVRKKTKKRENNFLWWLERLWAASGPPPRPPGPPGPPLGLLQVLFFEFFSKLNEILPKLDRLVLGCIEEFLNFLFDSVETLIFSCSFSTQNTKILKKKRENNFHENPVFPTSLKRPRGKQIMIFLMGRVVNCQGRT